MTTEYTDIQRGNETLSHRGRRRLPDTQQDSIKSQGRGLATQCSGRTIAGDCSEFRRCAARRGA